MMTRNFHRVIGEETRNQLNKTVGSLPDYLVACVGGGSNAIGFFYPFIDDEFVKMIGIEAAGLGSDTDQTAATITKGTPGVLHGSLSYLLQSDEGQIQLAHSVSAGLDYPGIGPEHAHLHDTKRVHYYGVTDQQAMEAVKLVSEKEGIIPAIETAHALAYLDTLMPTTQKDEIVVVNFSGRGDKDMKTISDWFA